jgi:hypothetical protein
MAGGAGPPAMGSRLRGNDGSLVYATASTRVDQYTTTERIDSPDFIKSKPSLMRSSGR